MSIQFWILTGAVYIGWVFASGYWHYMVPTHWSLFPDAIRGIGTYLQFHSPAKIPGEPFDPPQKLSYFLVVFVLAPLQIATGAAMSPSILARFPWYGKLFGGKQGARSLHFLGLCAFAAFTAVHTFMVFIHDGFDELPKIALGATQGHRVLGFAVGMLGIFLILLFHVIITWFSLRYRRATQRLLGYMVNPFERVLSRTFTSRQHFTRADISPYHLVNGYSPADPEYDRMAAGEFCDYRLPIGGLVENPVLLSLADLRGMGLQSQITKHNCIQGWTGIAEWTGVPLAQIVERVRPTDEAKSVVFYAFDDKGLTEGEGRFGHFYGSIPLYLATNPQTLLVVEMNGAPLPVEHGAPLRVRIETQLGFKMVKWIKGIEFVDDVSGIGQGQGGWREDQQFYANAGGI